MGMLKAPLEHQDEYGDSYGIWRRIVNKSRRQRASERDSHPLTVLIGNIKRRLEWTGVMISKGHDGPTTPVN
jgi:hypothetical protein